MLKAIPRDAEFNEMLAKLRGVKDAAALAYNWLAGHPAFTKEAKAGVRTTMNRVAARDASGRSPRGPWGTSSGTSRPARNATPRI